MTVVPASTRPVLSRRQLADEATRIAFIPDTTERVDGLLDLVDEAMRTGAAGQG